jgi:hypothetical protein
MSNYSISLGRCGPTDCTLTLNKDGSLSKEYGVESPAWKILGTWFEKDIEATGIPIAIGDFVYNNFDKDIINENN